MHRERAAAVVSVRHTSAALMNSRVAAAVEAAAAAGGGGGALALGGDALPAAFLQHYVPNTPGMQGAQPSGGLAGGPWTSRAALSRLHAAPGRLLSASSDHLPFTSGVSFAPPCCAPGFASAAASDPSLLQPAAASHGNLARLVAAAGQSVLDALKHVTATVLAAPLPLPPTRMRAPAPGMARELGLDAPPAPVYALHPLAQQQVGMRGMGGG